MQRPVSDQVLVWIILLKCVVLCVLTLLPDVLAVDTLLCNFCPLQAKGKSCPDNTTTRCLPQERCSTSKGRYGKVHILSAQGCIVPELCGSSQLVKHKGVKYNVTYTCCCRDHCNLPPMSDKSLKRLLGLKKTHTEESLTTENPLDSCPDN